MSWFYELTILTAYYNLVQYVYSLHCTPYTYTSNALTIHKIIIFFFSQNLFFLKLLIISNFKIT